MQGGAAEQDAFLGDSRDGQTLEIGTMAHEYLQSCQAIDVRLRDFRKAALEDRVQEYRGDLGVVLTDGVGVVDAFLAGKTLCSDATFLAYLRQIFHITG